MHIAHLIEIMAAVQLDFENWNVVLKNIARLEHQHFLTPQNERSIYASILADCLQRLAKLKAKPLDGHVIAAIGTIYVHLVRRCTHI